MKAPKVLNPRCNQLCKLCNTSLPVSIYVGYQNLNDKKLGHRGLQTHERHIKLYMDIGGFTAVPHFGQVLLGIIKKNKI